MRIVIANEPRSYRETMAAALHDLRPNLDIELIEPSELEGRLVESLPDLVICSRMIPVVLLAASWVVLYPDGKARNEICVVGERSSGDDLEFERLLSVVDRTEQLLPAVGAPGYLGN